MTFRVKRQRARSVFSFYSKTLQRSSTAVWFSLFLCFLSVLKPPSHLQITNSLSVYRCTSVNNTRNIQVISNCGWNISSSLFCCESEQNLKAVVLNLFESRPPINLLLLFAIPTMQVVSFIRSEDPLKRSDLKVENHGCRGSLDNY